MKNSFPPNAISLAAVIAITGWFALLLQFYELIFHIDTGTTTTEKVIQYFSYFTILTNILVAVCFTVIWRNRPGKWKAYFSQALTLTAITVYITFVGLAYSLLLRQLWDPQGWAKVANELLHTIVPAFCIVFWFRFVSRHQLEWNSFSLWLVYPLVYLAYALTRGAIYHVYPYPFLDVSQIGYPGALLNSLMLTLIFLVLSFIFIGISKLRTRKTTSA